MRGVGLFATAGVLAAALSHPMAAEASHDKCRLANGIEHIVYLQFDNVHLRRDIPNVPSDLEQMPNLLHFLENNGTMFTNHHTSLISHTSVGLLTALTGVYGDRFGLPIGNNIGLFDRSGVASFPSAFAYWTDLMDDGLPQMLDQRGKNAPAPWVPFTRAGCDVGAFSVANIEFENVTTDIDTVFGPTSPQHQEAATNRSKAIADFEGIAIHCAKGSPLCATTNSAPDTLNDEPGGYTGFTALFGNVNVQPQISPQGPVADLDGNVIADNSSPPNPGFPGFSPTASQTLGYLATMLEAGVPIVYGYIADTHDNRGPALSGVPFATPEKTFGPGEAGYVEQLQVYATQAQELFSAAR